MVSVYLTVRVIQPKDYEEASKIGLSLRSHSDLFALPSKPKAKVGIIINEENYQFCKSFYGTERHLSYSVRGWYHMLWRNGYPVDFVNITDINEKYSGTIFCINTSLSAFIIR